MALWSLADHDMLSQLNLIRNLRDAGHVECDVGCGSVLDMQQDEYLGAMERLYAPAVTASAS